MEEIRVGFALTGSFCTFEKALAAMEETAVRYPNSLPILSEASAETDTRFGRAAQWKERIAEICGPGYIG
ncbi:MAG: dipicolinate synthase subunit B, partial [Ruminiclostridium sp.]|nr:dipicolinate synthase subunit B [Ruminiclostridium sp.]